MPSGRLAHGLLLPELKLLRTIHGTHSGLLELQVESTSDWEVCPHCALRCSSVYDRRWVKVWDEPLRAKRLLLRIRKRRFWCKNCEKPFTEPIKGVRKGGRYTERYRKSLLWACEAFSSLKSVMQHYHCSSGFLYATFYAELERKRRARQHPWPKVIGIDEHYFRRLPGGFREFATTLVDYKGRCLMDMVQGRQVVQLENALAHIPGRENVHWVVLDMSDPFKTFAKGFFPNATLVADKFHVLRLLHPAINRRRKEITGDRRSLKIRRLLLRNSKKLAPLERALVLQWLEKHPELREVYHAKEALHGFYRIRGRKRAAKALTKMTDAMALSKVPEIKTLRRTLMRWRNEILAYFASRLTNGRTEGFNNKIKVVKRKGYGFKNFENYRLRCLNACAMRV